MIGLTITVINYEMDCGAANAIDPDEDEMELFPNPMDNPRNRSWYTNYLRCAVVFTSILSMLCNLRRFQLKMRWLDMKYQDKSGSSIGDADDLSEMTYSQQRMELIKTQIN